MKERNTEQKELILKELKNDYTHPTILELYEKLKKKNPKIGKATVYRNVNRLVKEGKVLKISLGKNEEHYDGHTHNHYHLYCKCCKKIYDIEDIKENEFREKIEKENNIQIDSTKIVFDGICKNCLEGKEVK